MNIIYFLIVEHKDEKQKREVDEALSEPTRRKRAAAIAALAGGEVIGQRR